MSEDDEVLPAGSAIGGYTVRRVLGRGGFGITYEAGNRVTGRNVAIKEFFPSRMARRGTASRLVYSQSDADMVTWALQKFEETTTTLCRLSHPNIVEVIDYVPANNTGYMIMELLDGTTLKDRLRARERAPTLDELRPLVEPVMDALTYVHGQGLVHRDIAPDNILITDDGRPVLIDFGSVSVGRADHGDASSTVGLTKRHYTAPEQMSAKTRPQPAADVYSMGAVVYRALCGIEPVDGLDRVDAMFLRKEADPYRPVAGMAGAGCPNRAATIIDKALDLRPDGRPRSIADLRRGLWPAEARPLLQGPKPVSVTMKLALVALVAGSVVGAALVGFHWSNDGRPRESASGTSLPASPTPSPQEPIPTPSAPAPEPAAPTPLTPVPTAYRAALLVEAPEQKDKVQTFTGTVVWTLLEKGADDTVGPSVEADVDLPDDKTKVRIVLSKNADASLPATHTIKVSFTVAPGSYSGDVKQVSVPQMRREGNSDGEPLAGVSVPVVANTFLVGLSPGNAETANLRLIQDLPWIDIPLLLSSKKIAKLTFEKGTVGQRDIAQALAAWAQK